MSMFSAISNTLRSLLGGKNTGAPVARSGTGSTSPVRAAPPSSVVSQNVSQVRAFANVILRYDDTQAYTNQAISCASYVKNSVNIPASSNVKTNSLVTAYVGNDVFRMHPLVSVVNPQITDVPDVSAVNLGSQARNNLFAFMDKVSNFIVQAKNSGFSPPSNPFAEISRLNSLRPNSMVEIVVSEDDASNILYNIQAYVDLLEAQAQGAINFTIGTFNVAQLEHISLSYGGLGGSGNTAADLMTLLPNADEIVKQKVDAQLAILNFNKRIPSVVFVADYSPSSNDGTQGSLIGWKKMPDASGFIIKRHGVLGNTDVSFDVSNTQVMNNNAAYMDYAKSYVLTFYDLIDPTNISLFLDSKPPADDYYIYTVQAYQTELPQATGIMPSDFIAMHLTGQQKIAITNSMQQLDPVDVNVTGQATISPWPIIAKQILGDDALDWVLADANIRASIDRKDQIATTRSYSYLNANLQFLFSQSDAGLLVRPSSVVDVQTAVANAIMTYGVTQTIEQLLQETGVLYYFDGVDATSNNVFSRAGTLDLTNSSIIGTVAAAIDPETATIDLRALATNIATVLTNGQPASYITGSNVSSQRSSIAKPSEISVLDQSAVSSNNGGVQFASVIDNVSDTIVDLTTYDGISQFIRVIRVMSDASPNRNQTIVPVQRPLPPTGSPQVVPLPPVPVSASRTIIPANIVSPSAAQAAGKSNIAQQLVSLQTALARIKTNQGA